MNADFAWTYMIATLSGDFQTRGPEYAAERAAETALYLAQDAGWILNAPRIHLAANAK